MKGFLDYLQGDTVLHKMHPLTKLFVAALLCASAFVSSDFFYLLGIIIFDILLGVVGEGKNHSGLFKRTLGIVKGLFKMSIFLFVLQILVIRRGEVVIPLGPKFGITDIGIRNGLLLVMRLTAATLPLSVLISVINLNDLSNSIPPMAATAERNTTYPIFALFVIVRSILYICHINALPEDRRSGGS